MKKPIKSYNNSLEEINNGPIQINEEVRLNHDLLVKSNSTKYKVLSIIAHDLRSPIGTIMFTFEVISQSLLWVARTIAYLA
jgi:hypothetical protein